MVITRRTQLSIYGVTALLMAILLFLGQGTISEYINGSNAGKIGLPELRQTYNTLPLHDGDQFDLTESFDKESIVGITNHATSTASPMKLLHFYSNELKARGWRQQGMVRRTGNSEKIRFCKSRMSLTVDAYPAPRGSRYYMGLIWTRYRMSADYCPGGL